MDFEQVIGNLRKKGSLLGYENEELTNYVRTETDKLEREERLERERLEREERAAKREAEKEKELKRIEAEKEKEIKQKELDHALELKRLEINSHRHSSGSTHSNDGNDHSRVEHYSPRINMVPFDEQKDRIDTYLATFEKIAKAYNIPLEHWTVNL